MTSPWPIDYFGNLIYAGDVAKHRLIGAVVTVMDVNPETGRVKVRWNGSGGAYRMGKGDESWVNCLNLERASE